MQRSLAAIIARALLSLNRLTPKVGALQGQVRVPRYLTVQFLQDDVLLALAAVETERRDAKGLEFGPVGLGNCQWSSSPSPEILRIKHSNKSFEEPSKIRKKAVKYLQSTPK